MIILGSFFDALYKEQQTVRMQLLDKFAKSGFNYIGTAINEGNQDFLSKCKDLGIMVGFQPNGGSDAWIKETLENNEHIKTVYTYDDANTRGTPDQVKESTERFRALMRPDQKTMFSGAWHSTASWPNIKDYLGIADIVGLQIYHWRWYWTRAFFEQCKAAVDLSPTQEFWAYPSNTRNYYGIDTQNFLNQNPGKTIQDFWEENHPTLKVQDYPDIEWMKMYVFSGLIAGIKNFSFYTAYFSDQKRNFFETTNFMMQPALSRMKELTSIVKKYEDYFDQGVRTITVEEPTKIEAQWVLNGKTLKMGISNLQPDPQNSNIAANMTMIPQVSITDPDASVVPPTKPVTIVIGEKQIVIPSQTIIIPEQEITFDI